MNKLYSHKGELNIRTILETLETYHGVTDVPVFYIDSHGKRISSVGEEFYFCQLLDEYSGIKSV